MQIELNIAAIEGLSKAASRAAELTAEAMLTDVRSAQVMPFDNGDMQNNGTHVMSRLESGEAVNSIVTTSPQARRLYHHPEYNFQIVNNPNAQGEWLQPWLDGDKSDSVVDKFAEIMREEAKL